MQLNELKPSQARELKSIATQSKKEPLATTSYALPEDFNNWLFRNRFEFAGDGAYSRVFFVNEQRSIVLKISYTEDKAYEYFVNLVNNRPAKLKNNPHFPKLGKIHHFNVIKNGKNYQGFFILMEKLDRYYPDDIDEVLEYVSDLHFLKYFREKNIDDYENEKLEEAFEALEWLKMNYSSFYQAFDYVLKNIPSFGRLDFHDENFLLRNTIPVIVDPYAID